MFKKQHPPVLLNEFSIKRRTRALAKEITADYRDLKGELVIICVLQGGVFFFTDLVRHLKLPHQTEFISVSSYGKGKRSSSQKPKILQPSKLEVKGKHVLLVEDIVDTGHTAALLLSHFQAQKPASLKLCTLLDKPSRRQIEAKIDYLGFTIPDRFVYGYGLDLDEQLRNLPYIAVHQD